MLSIWINLQPEYYQIILNNIHCGFTWPGASSSRTSWTARTGSSRAGGCRRARAAVYRASPWSRWRSLVAPGLWCRSHPGGRRRWGGGGKTLGSPYGPTGSTGSASSSSAPWNVCVSAMNKDMLLHNDYWKWKWLRVIKFFYLFNGKSEIIKLTKQTPKISHTTF